jgi:ankyrin repeat protein
MSLPPPPQSDDPIITQFKPVQGQWELNDDNIKRIDPKNGRTILHNYCFYINTTPLEVYKFLIEVKGCDINVQDNLNETPIYPALRFWDPNDGGNISVLIYLLTQTNINVNAKGWNGETLLHYVCQKINKLPIDVFKLLIEKKGCDVNARANDNDTPLHYAFDRINTSQGVITVLAYLINQKNVDVNVKGKKGFNLLHKACQKINYLPLDIFKVLIETKGCDVNAQDNDKNTPIHSAFDQFNPRNGGDVNVLAYLINQNTVNINIKGRCDRTLLHTTCVINLSSLWDSADPNAENDTILCQIVEMIVEMIVERCVEQVLDELTL